jgi:hypothetical protein
VTGVFLDEARDSRRDQPSTSLVEMSTRGC